MRAGSFLNFTVLTVFVTLVHSSSGYAGDAEFFTVVDDAALAEDDLVEYQVGPHVLRYQIISVDVTVLREFVVRDTELSDSESALPLRLAFFDEEPVDYFGEIRQLHAEGVGLGFAGWIGLSEGDIPFTAKVMIGSKNQVTLTADSDIGNFKISPTDFPPYHVLWQWNPDFQQVPVTKWEDAL